MAKVLRKEDGATCGARVAHQEGTSGLGILRAVLWRHIEFTFVATNDEVCCTILLRNSRQFKHDSNHSGMDAAVLHPVTKNGVSLVGSSFVRPTGMEILAILPRCTPNRKALFEPNHWVDNFVEYVNDSWVIDQKARWAAGDMTVLWGQGFRLMVNAPGLVGDSSYLIWRQDRWSYQEAG
jgi:hypothetical protein